jgi:alkyl sulfatase BDS1-like metallo-beta-lactamase superfamily hydrolase
MKIWSFAFVVVAVLAAAALPLNSLAEDQPKMSAAQIAEGQSKAGVANALIIIGRSAKDADMMMVAAKLLADIDAPVADPKASSADGKPAYYDVDAIVTEADGYAANAVLPSPLRQARGPASATTNISATA